MIGNNLHHVALHKFGAIQKTELTRVKIVTITPRRTLQDTQKEAGNGNPVIDLIYMR